MTRDWWVLSKSSCRAVLLAASLAPLAGCEVAPDHATLREARLPPFVPTHRFAYRANVHRSYQLSPDGGKLAWMGPSYARSALHVRDNASGEVRKYRIRSASFEWTPDGRRLLYLADPSGAENAHLFMLDTGDPAAEPVDLTPWAGTKVATHQVSPADPGRVLVTHNRRDRKVFDLYRIDFASGKETLVAQNPGDAISPLIALDGTFKGWKKSRSAQRLAQGPAKPLAARRPALRLKPEETFRPLGLSADRKVVWALSNRGRDRLALVAADPVLGWEKVLFEDPQVDVSEAQLSRVTRAPLIAYAQPGYPRFEILDPTLREDLAPFLKAQGDGPFGLDIVSTDTAEKRLVLVVYTSSKRSFYLVDRPSRSHVLLAETDFTDALGPMRPVTIGSRDGLTLHGYLTLPAGVAPKRLPMVLLAHGGPWMRTTWGDPLGSADAALAQFLANRGYAVLQVDFRGSVGYGRKFEDAGMGEFAARMHEDLLDAVRWAVDGGVADPARVAIMGWSYGGYATLVGLTMTPDVFACGVSLNGPSDLVALIESFPPYWTDLSRWHDFVGDPAVPEDREEMKLKSPLNYAEKLERPVLIVHGARDVRVRVDQSERMVEALRRAGKPVEYLGIADMGHDSGWWVHRLAVLRRTEDFLQRCLGGRSSRFDPYEAVAWAWWRLNQAPAEGAGK